MTLTLRAVSLNDQPLTQPITAHFDSQGGTIGRSDQNTMALPDPERHISRQQAQILATGAAYAIKNVGSANPIVVRGQTLAQGEVAALRNRDQVRIGGYLLEVVEEHQAEATTITRGRATVDALVPVPRTGPPGNRPAGPAGPVTGALGDFGAPLSSSNPFADLIGGAPPQSPAPAAYPAVPEPPTARRPTPGRPAERLIDPFADLPPPAGVPAASAAWKPPPAPPAAAPALPHDFNPFAARQAAQRPLAPAPGGGGAFDDLIPNAAPASIDDLFNLQGNSRDPLADFLAGAPTAPRPEAAAPSGVSTDPFAMFGDARPAAPASSHTPANHTPELRGAFSPPAVKRPPPAAPDAMLPTGIDWLAVPAGPRPTPPAAPVPVPAPPPRAAVPPREPPRPAAMPVMQPAMTAPPLQAPLAARQAGPAPGTAELWTAFCEGAGIGLNPPQGLNPELMKVIGSLLRSAVDGTLKLVAVRAATKHELRAQVTVIQARNNNPLKFSPDSQLATEQLLQPPVRGFLSGPSAMQETMDDLLGHSIGTMAGTRAALDGVLDRFAPNELEAKLSGKSVLDSVMPMNRKAKLWELYLQHFQAIRNEAQDDFQALFGKAFVAAYEQQLERLRREKSRGS